MDGPDVQITKFLTDSLSRIGADVTIFVSDFFEWKVDWDKHEFDSYYFGKDGAYELPNVGGRRYALKHVHLPPHPSEAGVDDWNRAHRRKKRKHSDRCLVYVERKPTGPYLLVAILDEGAHEVARMKTDEDRVLMEFFADIADDFLTYGRNEF